VAGEIFALPMSQFWPFQKPIFNELRTVDAAFFIPEFYTHVAHFWADFGENGKTDSGQRDHASRCS
jgi:hypothetical protein